MSAHTSTMSELSADPSRRAFLVGVCGAAVLGAGLGSALLADDAVAATGIRRKKNGQVVVTVAKVPSLQATGGRALLGTVKGTPVAVVREADGSFAALNLACTHQGVTVNPDAAGWLCPAHGSKFALDGAMERGPATTNLAAYPSRWDVRRGTLTVG
jgi:Rieske Fe-S protein